MLWYGFDSAGSQEQLHRQIRHTFHAPAFYPAVKRLWGGEITLSAIHTPDYPLYPGLMGCGIILSNVSGAALAACQHLGEALEALYAPATLPLQQSGSLTFSTPAF